MDLCRSCATGRHRCRSSLGRCTPRPSAACRPTARPPASRATCGSRSDRLRAQRVSRHRPACTSVPAEHAVGANAAVRWIRDPELRVLPGRPTFITVPIRAAAREPRPRSAARQAFSVRSALRYGSSSHRVRHGSDPQWACPARGMREAVGRSPEIGRLLPQPGAQAGAAGNSPRGISPAGRCPSRRRDRASFSRGPPDSRARSSS